MVACTAHACPELLIDANLDCGNIHERLSSTIQMHVLPLNIHTFALTHHKLDELTEKNWPLNLDIQNYTNNSQEYNNR